MTEVLTDKPSGQNGLLTTPGSVRTHYAPHMKEAPWIALDMAKAVKLLDGYDLTAKEKTDLPAMMAGYCRLIDEAGLLGYGKTELEAKSSIPGAVVKFPDGSTLEGNQAKLWGYFYSQNGKHSHD
jgi:hypothetical protein